ncbi:PDZ domain-containing [Pyrenophora seminiperda CCB06]|uniref:PDZ domain-containing n=1 Tax=Pyrenophora seminiperda CCB06 TaxID=1302712 RepID=A0A3M7MAK7_9PLEO|nr:PDZ domain-containing [Pyrenophora seminiperda CCB06]
MLGFERLYFVTHVNNVLTQNLSEFLTETKKIKDNEYFSLRCETIMGDVFVFSMKGNEEYFPTT